MRELPESTARDQDHLVPLVAEVVMLSKHGKLNITSLHGLVTHSMFGIAVCHCFPFRYFLWPCPQHSFGLTLPLDSDCCCARCSAACRSAYHRPTAFFAGWPLVIGCVVQSELKKVKCCFAVLAATKISSAPKPVLSCLPSCCPASLPGRQLVCWHHSSSCPAPNSSSSSPAFA